MSSPSACDTLRVLHLPPYLSDEKRNELFSKYGATNTKTIRKSEKYTTTFVKFPTKEIATKAFLQLHQLEVKGHHLSIEFAKKSLSELTDSGTIKSETINEGDKTDTANTAYFQAFIKKLNAWTSNYAFSQPPPPNLTYKYPLPTRNTLLRIAIQLVREPAFYTQVLHLMNKMNLPPPFEELEAEFPTLKEVYDIEKYRDIFGKMNIEKGESLNDYNLFNEEKYDMEEHAEDDNEEESEMESDVEDENKPKEIIPVKRKLSQSKKRIKIPKFINPTKQMTSTTLPQKIIRPEDMFEPVQREETKNLKIELKTAKKFVESEEADVEKNTPILEEGGFGLMFPAKKDGDDEANNEKPETSEKSKEFITSEELAANRISANDQRLLPVFKQYHPGKPSCRLYIKNLAKQVEVNDLHYIYRRYIVPSLENSESQYDVRLMQDGRMKGQAFITFQNMGQAQLALNDTNGYILKDKPMVVQFAKPTKS
ncbi:hypothetical protein PV325_013542 [Microctonus aethiopoides]|uniref:RNA-binding region-containing protein 3 n=1 Tax=Microctonus aethiopoides TaxID=144406 RepID=A0AA39FIT6_9HYME|nr:hypothetical protein PV325_013542 [Microctonus aethiopoides]KAK0089456.1 hypothetical protein PV326_004481 [Microctonus aethiopoides]KAK0170241.1 hypothetical protein PV328_010823 [Microctonus aethiopoides]